MRRAWKIGLSVLGGVVLLALLRDDDEKTTPILITTPPETSGVAGNLVGTPGGIPLVSGRYYRGRIDGGALQKGLAFGILHELGEIVFDEVSRTTSADEAIAAGYPADMIALSGESPTWFLARARTTVAGATRRTEAIPPELVALVAA